MTTATDAAAHVVTSVTQKLQFAIRATPDEVWRALTDGEITPAYYVGFRAEFDLTPGGRYRYTAGGGDVITGTVLAVRPGLLLQTMVRSPTPRSNSAAISCRSTSSMARDR